jgi:adenosylcobinamide kinase/adenosylcobinamide-phosphate guanylyltransferase
LVDILKRHVTFVIGGCRSGKSSYALDQANKVKGSHKYFIATSVPMDSEMEQRVIKHRQERGDDWQTIEEPVLIHEKIREKAETADVILVDCLTLWVSNLLFHGYDDQGVETLLTALENALESSKCPVFLVSNEVGCGIVPENRLARAFRDAAGFVNQRMAKAADSVVMTIAGIDVQIKPGNGSQNQTMAGKDGLTSGNE